MDGNAIFQWSVPMVLMNWVVPFFLLATYVPRTRDYFIFIWVHFICSSLSLCVVASGVLGRNADAVRDNFALIEYTTGRPMSADGTIYM